MTNEPLTQVKYDFDPKTNNGSFWTDVANNYHVNYGDFQKYNPQFLKPNEKGVNEFTPISGQMLNLPTNLVNQFNFMQGKQGASSTPTPSSTGNIIKSAAASGAPVSSMPQISSAPTAPMITSNLGPGSKGADVSNLQNYLVSQGYLTQQQVATGPGIYGPQTTAAVAAWQKANGIDTKGNAGYFGPISQGFLKTGLLPTTAPTSAGNINPIASTTLPSNTPLTGNISGAVGANSGAQAYLNTQDQIQKDRLAQIQSEQNLLTTQNKPFLDRILNNPTPAETRASALSQTGIDPTQYFADQKAKIAEIDSLTQEYNATKAAMDAQVAQSNDALGTTDFINNQISQIQRNAAPKLNELSANINSKAATLQALQGNFAAAQNFVNQAVQDATANEKYNLDLYTTFAQQNKDAIAALDAPYQTAYQNALNQAQTEYNRAEADTQQVGQLMLQYPTAGISLTDNLQAAFAKAAPVAKQNDQNTVANVVEENGKKFAINKYGDVVAKYDQFLGGSGGGKVLSPSDAATLGVPYGTTDIQAMGANPVNADVSKQNSLDAQTVDSAYQTVVGTLKNYGLSPETLTKNTANKISDVDAISIGKAIARMQNPDIARMGGDVGSVLDPQSLGEHVSQWFRKAFTGQQYPGSKIVEAVKAATGLQNQRTGGGNSTDYNTYLKAIGSQ